MWWQQSVFTAAGQKPGDKNHHLRRSCCIYFKSLWGEIPKIFSFIRAHDSVLSCGEARLFCLRQKLVMLTRSSVLCKSPRTGLQTDPHLSPGQFQGSWLLFRPQKWPDLSPLQMLGKPDPKSGFNLDLKAPFLSMLIKATLCSVWTIDIKAHELAARRTYRLYECPVVAVNKTYKETVREYLYLSFLHLPSCYCRLGGLLYIF